MKNPVFALLPILLSMAFCASAKADLSRYEVEDLGEHSAPFVQAQNSDLRGAILHNYNFPHGNFYGALLERAEFMDAQIRGGNFQAADATAAHFSGAILTSANFFLARLIHADLRGADLNGANLQDANLEGANLSGADLRGANLYDTAFCSGNLEGDRWSLPIFTGAKFNEQTLSSCYPDRSQSGDYKSDIKRLTDAGMIFMPSEKYLPAGKTKKQAQPADLRNSLSPATLRSMANDIEKTE